MRVGKVNVPRCRLLDTTIILSLLWSIAKCFQPSVVSTQSACGPHEYHEVVHNHERACCNWEGTHPAISISCRGRIDDGKPAITPRGERLGCPTLSKHLDKTISLICYRLHPDPGCSPREAYFPRLLFGSSHSPTACRLSSKRLPTPSSNGRRRRRHVCKNCFCNARTCMRKESCRQVTAGHCSLLFQIMASTVHGSFKYRAT